MPKKGDVVWVRGALAPHTRKWEGHFIFDKTLAIVEEGGIDPAGATLLCLPMQGSYWAKMYQFVYSDTGLAGDGQSPVVGWDDE